MVEGELIEGNLNFKDYEYIYNSLLYGKAKFSSEIIYKDGMVEQKNFYSYNMPRITDVPHIEVHIMENDADAGGVGEPGLPAFTPALTNAIYDLTGKRIRKLPFDLGKIL